MRLITHPIDNQFTSEFIKLHGARIGIEQNLETVESYNSIFTHTLNTLGQLSGRKGKYFRIFTSLISTDHSVGLFGSFKIQKPCIISSCTAIELYNVMPLKDNYLLDMNVENWNELVMHLAVLCIPSVNTIYLNSIRARNGLNIVRYEDYNSKLDFLLHNQALLKEFVSESLEELNSFDLPKSYSNICN